MLHPAVGKVEIVGDCRVFGSKRVNLLDVRHDTVTLTMPADTEHGIIDRFVICLQNMAGYLEVTETVDLGMKQFLNRDALNGVIFLKTFLYVLNVLQLVQEPPVYLSELAYPVNVKAFLQCLCY